MPIPDATRAVIAPDKVRDYLLNLEHADGGSKAICFHSLGYRREQWPQLADDLLPIARASEQFETETTRNTRRADRLVARTTGPEP